MLELADLVVIGPSGVGAGVGVHVEAMIAWLRARVYKAPARCVVEGGLYL